MALQNWYEIGEMARVGRAPRATSAPNGAPLITRKRCHRARPPRELHLKRWALVFTILMLFTGVALCSVSIRTTANTSPRQSSSPSRTTPVPFVTSSGPLVYTNPVNVTVGSVGSTFTVQVKVLNMPQFNGWDIRVWAAPWIINATGLSITGNDFQVNASSGTPFEIIHCVNGAGTGCASTDTIG